MDPIDPLYLSDSLVQQSLMMCPFGRTVLQELSLPMKRFGVSLSRVAFLKSKQLLFLLILLSVESRFLASLLQLLTLSGRSQRVHLLDADGLSNSNCSSRRHPKNVLTVIVLMITTITNQLGICSLETTELVKKVTTLIWERPLSIKKPQSASWEETIPATLFYQKGTSSMIAKRGNQTNKGG